jgi:hypothetical protein
MRERQRFLGIFLLRAFLPICAALAKRLAWPIIAVPSDSEAHLTKQDIETVVEAAMRKTLRQEVLENVTSKVGNELLALDLTASSAQGGAVKQYEQSAEGFPPASLLAKAKCYAYLNALYATLVLVIITLLHYFLADWEAASGSLQPHFPHASAQFVDFCHLVWVGLFGSLLYSVMYPFISFASARFVLRYVEILENVNREVFAQALKESTAS